jgi:hypothetical protein
VHRDVNVSPRSLVFVERSTDIAAPPVDSLVVVLDPAWTPAPGAPSQLWPVRPLFERVVEHHDLFTEALERLDAWASAAGAIDRFSAAGVTWWFHARGKLRWEVGELLLWRYVLEELMAEGPFRDVAVPPTRTALVAVARATAASGRGPLVTHRGSVPVSVRVAERYRALAVLMTRIRRRARLWLDPRSARRGSLLAERVKVLAAEPGAILGLVRGQSFHVIDDGSGPKRDDPYVGPVLQRIAAANRPVVRVGLGMDHRRNADWRSIRSETSLIPMSIVERLFKPSSSERRETARLAASIASLGDVPLLLGGMDLGPSITRLVAGEARWFTRQRLAMCSAERFMAHLGIRAVFTGWESARTSWLGAARRLGIPSVAVQHGVIYPNTPDYSRPALPALVKPDITCVFGTYERDLLIREGGYDPATVVVTGSPRANPDGATVGSSPGERDATRHSLGVADGDRLLVVSTARHTIGDEVQSMAMVGRLLHGSLPGVHVAFKLHPEEEERDHYQDLLVGLARAGGYPAPPVSVVRDIDVYQLLRSADAHLGQYSTVLTDAVLTGTPNMIAVGQAWSDPIGYVDADVAVPVRSVDEVRAFMAAPRSPTAEARRAFLEAHYRSGDAAARIADMLVGVAGSGSAGAS